jgi:hypothetical protein
MFKSIVNRGHIVADAEMWNFADPGVRVKEG